MRDGEGIPHLHIWGGGVKFIQQRRDGMGRELAVGSNTVLKAVFQVLRGDAVGIVRGRSEGDWEVVIYSVEQDLRQLAGGRKGVGPENTYLGMVRDIPFHHYNL